MSEYISYDISYDITFCTRECGNNKCKRNKKRLEGWIYPVSIACFDDCENYKKAKKVKK